MGKICKWAIVLIGFGMIGTGIARAQDGDDAQACWWEYASCARQSFGDATWRSVCYADFSTCIGKMQLPACPATPDVADCLAYKTECDAIAALMPGCWPIAAQMPMPARWRMDASSKSHEPDRCGCVR